MSQARTRFSPSTLSPALCFGIIPVRPALVWLAMRDLEPTVELPFCAIRSSFLPTTPTCWRSTAPTANCSGRLLWRPTSINPTAGTMAPLIVHDTVIAGVAGADHGIRGFVAAFKPDTGALVWRHWTVPLRGEPGIETWQGKEPIAGGGSTWLTGSYDPSSDTLYWPTGNPWPDGDDRDRPGDNLYTNCVLALNAKTGDLQWHYQFTPHDLKDRDATDPNVLVDTVYKGKPSKLLLHADRNGFFYLLDRTNGELLLAQPFLRRVDWA